MSDRATYTVDELCAVLGMGKRQAYDALRDGKIPCLRFGKRYIIPRAAVAKWLESVGKTATGATPWPESGVIYRA